MEKKNFLICSFLLLLTGIQTVSPHVYHLYFGGNNDYSLVFISTLKKVLFITVEVKCMFLQISFLTQVMHIANPSPPKCR